MEQFLYLLVLHADFDLYKKETVVSKISDLLIADLAALRFLAKSKYKNPGNSQDFYYDIFMPASNSFLKICNYHTFIGRLPFNIHPIGV